MRRLTLAALAAALLIVTPAQAQTTAQFTLGPNGALAWTPATAVSVIRFAATGLTTIPVAPGATSYNEAQNFDWACYGLHSPEVYPGLCQVRGTQSPQNPVVAYIGAQVINGSPSVFFSYVFGGSGTPPDRYLLIRSDGHVDQTTNQGLIITPYTGTACYVLAAIRQNQAVGWSQILCTVPNTQAASTTTGAPQQSTGFGISGN